MRDRKWLIEHLASHMDPLTPLEKRHIKKSLGQFKTATLEQMVSDLEARGKAAIAEEYRLLPWFKSLFVRKKASPVG